jgi:nitrate reductase NapE component
MEKLKAYKKQIVTFVTIFLLLEFGIFPCLTAQSTAFNFVGAIGLLLLIIWGALELYDWAKKSNELVDKQELKEVIEASEEELKTKKRSNPKQFDDVKSEEPFVKTRKKKKNERNINKER